MGKFYHLDVGCGDATIIQTGTATFLVDCHDIERYKHLLPAHKILRGVFITHAHDDHYSGLDFLRRHGYTIQFLVYSPYQRRFNDASLSGEEWQEFNRHVAYFRGRGTKIFPAYRQTQFVKPYWSTDGISFWMLGPFPHLVTSTTREVHDACLVFKAMLGNRSCLFTGDASDTNLAYVAANTNNICGDILHASHHGSLQGADLSFIKKCAAQYTVISTCTGVYESVPHPTALARYTAHTSGKLYRTDAGTVTWTF